MNGQRYIVLAVSSGNVLQVEHIPDETLMPVVLIPEN